MNTQKNSTLLSESSIIKPFLIIVALLAIFFIYDNAFRYFNWSEESYGPYYWQYRLPLLFHIIGGVIALLAGVFQLWSGSNNTQMKLHPLTGRVYVFGIIIGSIGGIILSISTDTYGITFGLALFCLSLVWLTTTGAALYCIKKRRIQLHQQWMTRSYIATFGFVFFRIVTDYLPYQEWWGISRQDISNATIWAVWVIPLIIYEVYLLKNELK